MCAFPCSSVIWHGLLLDSMEILLSSLSMHAQAGGKLTVSFSEAPQLANAFDSLASFSSKGPTKDGRLGVGLLAPGTLQSAYTDGSNTCSLRQGRLSQECADAILICAPWKDSI